MHVQVRELPLHTILPTFQRAFKHRCRLASNWERKSEHDFAGDIFTGKETVNIQPGKDSMLMSISVFGGGSVKGINLCKGFPGSFPFNQGVIRLSMMMPQPHHWHGNPAFSAVMAQMIVVLASQSSS